MKVELLYIHDCPNHFPTLEIVKEVFWENGLTPEITEIEISNPTQAAELLFLGSPTVRVDGKDVERGAFLPKHFGVSCRSYVVKGTRQGTPDPEWIRKAIRTERER